MSKSMTETSYSLERKPLPFMIRARTQHWHNNARFNRHYDTQWVQEVYPPQQHER